MWKKIHERESEGAVGVSPAVGTRGERAAGFLGGDGDTGVGTSAELPRP